MGGLLREEVVDEGPDLGGEVLEELFVLAGVGPLEEVAGQEEEGSACPWVFRFVEVEFDEVGDLQLIIHVVGDAVLCHVVDLLRLQLQVVQGVLQVVQVHLNIKYRSS